MSYGVNISDLYRRAARYEDRILKDAKPGELPIEQPTRFQCSPDGAARDRRPLRGWQ